VVQGWCYNCFLLINYFVFFQLETGSRRTVQYVIASTTIYHVQYT
jgi:hypothetical protein